MVGKLDGGAEEGEQFEVSDEMRERVSEWDRICFEFGGRESGDGVF